MRTHERVLMSRLSRVPLAVLLLALTACSQSTEAELPSSATNDYFGGRGQCVHFANVFLDFGKGILTNEELRAKTKEVYDGTRYAEPEIEQAATAALRAATQDDLDAFLTAAELMADAGQDYQGPRRFRLGRVHQAPCGQRCRV